MDIDISKETIKILKELGFSTGKTAYLNHEPVQLDSDPEMEDEAAVIVYIKDWRRHKIHVSELESPETKVDDIDNIIDDIQNNPTPIKETWVLQLQSVKKQLIASDPLRERRRNQYMLVNEIETLRMKIAAIKGGGMVDADLQTIIEDYEGEIRLLKTMFLAIGRSDKDPNTNTMLNWYDCIKLEKAGKILEKMFQEPQPSYGELVKVKAIIDELINSTQGEE